MEISVSSGKSLPDWKMCYISRPDYRLQPISEIEAQAIITLLSMISGKEKSIIAWFSCEEDGPFPYISDAQEIKQNLPEGAESEPLFCKLFESQREAADNLVGIWNAFGGVRIFPADSIEDIKLTVEPNFNNSSDAKRFGFDYVNKWWIKSKNPIILLFGDIGSILWFSFKLFFLKKYRGELLDPFCYKTHTDTVKKCKIYMWKGGYDDAVTLEFMTSKSDIVQTIQEIFTASGISFNIKSDNKTDR